MGAGGGPCGCAVNAFVRGLTAVGTDVYVGTDANDVAGIAAGRPRREVGRVGVERRRLRTPAAAERVVPAGDHRSTTWPASARTSSPPGRSRTRTATRAPTTSPSSTAPPGTRSGPTAPATARGSATGLALALVDRQLYAAGNFTSAGGDTQAQSAASFALSQVIAYPTPTVTAGPSARPDAHGDPGPSAVPTPTVTPSPPRLTPRRPTTSLRSAKINQAKRKATFRFASGEPGSRFPCKLDKQEVQALHLAEDLQEAQARQARVPRQGARPRRQRRPHADGQAVQDQEALAGGIRARVDVNGGWVGCCHR